MHAHMYTSAMPFAHSHGTNLPTHTYLAEMLRCRQVEWVVRGHAPKPGDDAQRDFRCPGVPCTMVLHCDACWDEWELPADSERCNSCCIGGNLREWCQPFQNSVYDDFIGSFESFYPCSCGEEDVYCSHCFRKWERRWEDTMAKHSQTGGFEWDSVEHDPEDERFWSDDQRNGSGLGFTHSEAMAGILGFMLRPEW